MRTSTLSRREQLIAGGATIAAIALLNNYDSLRPRLLESDAADEALSGLLHCTRYQATNDPFLKDQYQNDDRQQG
jgi:hypothetical protein